MNSLLQQHFDKATGGILRQGRPSFQQQPAKCLYRSEGGCKCAIGFLIDDELYKPDMEHFTVYRVLVQAGVSPFHAETHLEFYQQLQEDHDHAVLTNRETPDSLVFLARYILNSRSTAREYGLDLTTFDATLQELGYSA